MYLQRKLRCSNKQLRSEIECLESQCGLIAIEKTNPYILILSRLSTLGDTMSASFNAAPSVSEEEEEEEEEKEEEEEREEELPDS